MMGNVGEGGGTTKKPHQRKEKGHFFLFFFSEGDLDLYRNQIDNAFKWVLRCSNGQTSRRKEFPKER